MRFTILTQPTARDVPLCRVKVPEVRSERVVSTSSFAPYIEGNTRPRALSYSANLFDISKSGGFYITTESYLGIPAVTDEVYYIPETKEETPLFYLHPLVHYYFTHRKFTHETVLEGSTISDPVTINIPVTKGSTLVRNSVRVWTTGYGGERECDSVVVDAGRLTATVYHSHHNCTKVVVRYSSIPLDYSLSGPRLAVHRCEVLESSLPFLYEINILSTTNKPLEVEFVTYDHTQRASRVVREVTSPTDAMEYVPIEHFLFYLDEIMNGDIRVYRNYRVYSFYDNSVFALAPSGVYYLRPRDMSSDTRVSAKVPQRIPVTHDWFPCTTRMQITNTYGTYGFRPETDNGTCELVEELTEGSNSKVIPLHTGCPKIYRTHDGYVGGITAVVNGSEIAKIVAFDIDSRSMHLERSYTQQHHIVCSYVASAPVRCTDITLNPLLPSHAGSYTSRDNVIVLLMAPTEICKSLMSGVLPMYTDRGMPITYTYNTIFTLFNNEDIDARILARERYIPLLPPSVAMNPDAILIPVAAFYTTNPLSLDSFVLEDARTLGGGRRVYTPYSFDYSTYDGEATDFSSLLYVSVATQLIDDFAGRIAEHDADALLAEDTYLYSLSVARERIRELLKRASLPGTELHIKEK